MRFRTLSLVFSSLIVLAQRDIPPGSLNRPERLEWFRDQGFGLFIHWSVDSQTGVVISHSLAGADEAYTKRFFEELPKTFNPRKFEPRDWAALAKLAGIKYVVFTTKHHSGFAMWDTKTTDFGIMHTPYRRDLTRGILDAFRAQGIAPGIYFSPDDFWWLWKNKIDVQRGIPGVQPRNNPGLMKLDLAQMQELMTGYGPIDIVFLDGEPEGLRDLAWKLQPNTIVTRGAIQTPELYVPGIPLEGAWEANFTMGTAWQYQPQNEQYKTGGNVIDLLVETRAKGGNLLLNIGPKPDGELPIEQEERLREVALWMQVNQECIYGVRPWVITNEQNVWYTKAKNEDTVYAIVKQQPRWVRGQWRDFVLKSLQATPESKVSVLGQNDRVLEYRPEVNPKPTLRQEADGLHVRAMFTHRLQDNSRWPNPIVLKITNVRSAFTPPKLETRGATFDAANKAAMLSGTLLDLGKVPSLVVGFEYRSIVGLDASDRSIPWQPGPSTTLSTPGNFTLELPGLNPEGIYEYRAYAKHPLLTIYGADRRLTVPARASFPWPAGKRVAVSLSFDDARGSQVLTGLELFQRHGARVTFYVNPGNMAKNVEGWKTAVARGHEIGNHSTTHPCSGNFSWSRKNSLEEYSASRMQEEFDTANRDIERMLGVKAATFAYPCGTKFIGRGAATQSYVPLVAKTFRAGRGFRDEAANDPAYVDLAQLLGVDSDGMTFEAMKEAVRKAEQQGGWLVFAGHEIGKPGSQTTEAAVLEQFLRFANDPANGVWLDTVDAIASYVQKHRPTP